MKKRIGFWAIVMVIIAGLVLAGCGSVPSSASGGSSVELSGTYNYGSSNSITFSGNRFTVRSGDTIITGNYTVSGNRFVLTNHNRSEGWMRNNWTIVDANTIRDSDGDTWRKQATSQTPSQSSPTVASRIAVPQWIRAGMTLAQVQAQIPQLTSGTEAGQEFAGMYYYFSNNNRDFNVVRISENGLERYSIVLGGVNTNTARQELTRVYGDPLVQNNNRAMWLIVGNPRSIYMITLEPSSSNPNDSNVEYYFSVN